MCNFFCTATDSSREGFRRAKMVGIMESLRVERELSPGASPEYMELPEELWELLSRFDLPRRWKMFLLKTWTLSGRSREGLLLVVERCDERRVRDMLSRACSQAGRSPVDERCDEEPDEAARWPGWGRLR